MEILRKISEVQRYIQQQKADNKLIGFVPTMGALHEGHLTLIKKAQEDNDIVIASIFVNPRQFDKAEDLEKYPRLEEQDFDKLRSLGCSAVFAPSVEEVYASQTSLQFSFGKMEEVMEGAFRKGHFHGVALVLSRLFHWVQPDAAYFGQKDFQQCAIVRQLISDLAFPIRFVRVDTVREKDGLAMSSRNLRLTSEERAMAPLLYETMCSFKEDLLSGNSIKVSKDAAFERIRQNKAFTTEYLVLCDAETLQEVEVLEKGKEYAICIASFLGSVRLIDNIIFTFSY